MTAFKSSKKSTDNRNKLLFLSFAGKGRWRQLLIQENTSQDLISR
jgi:hypothetical protein